MPGRKREQRMFAGRTTNRWTQCNVCERTMQLGDIFVNVPDPAHGTGGTTVVCLSCTHDIGNSIDEMLRSEDRDLAT